MGPRESVVCAESSPSSVSVSATLARLATADRCLRRHLDELHSLDRRLDRALAYRLDPAAHPGLARAYLDRVRTRHHDAAERLKRARHDAQRAIREADGLLGAA